MEGKWTNVTVFQWLIRWLMEISLTKPLQHGHESN